MEHKEIVGALANFFDEEDIVEETDVLFNGTDLIDSGIVDSLVLVMLVMFCEERFDCALEPDELVEDNFRSLEKIAEYIGTKMGPS